MWMRMVALGVALAGVVLGAGAARGDGCLMPSREAWLRDREKAYIEEPEQKGLIAYSSGVEDLIISPSFKGSPDQFAWVVPVPSRPSVRVLKGDIFRELMELVAPEAGRDAPTGQGGFGGGGYGGASAVRVLERKAVGDYAVTVLDASDGRALMRWLDANGYHLPAQAERPIQAYVSERWTFVACKIRPGDSASGLQRGMLAPLRLTFRAKQPVYPMRLSSANPGPFTVQLYVALKAREFPAAKRLQTVSRPGSRGPESMDLAGTFRPNASYPTLSALVAEPALIYHNASRGSQIEPRDCTADYVWAAAPRMASK